MATFKYDSQEEMDEAFEEQMELRQQESDLKEQIQATESALEQAKENVLDIEHDLENYRAQLEDVQNLILK